MALNPDNEVCRLLAEKPAEAISAGATFCGSPRRRSRSNGSNNLSDNLKHINQQSGACCSINNFLADIGEVKKR
jgi:hypothetical protein